VPDKKQARTHKASVSRKLFGWLLGVGGTVATTVVVSFLVPYVRDNLVAGWGIAREYLQYPVPAWALGAAVLAVMALSLIFRRVRKRTDPDAELLTYTTDSFGPWHFHWTWTRDRFGRRAIRHLSAICSVHDLVLRKVGSELVCPKCRRTYPALDHGALDQFRHTIAKKAAARYGVEL
jgi:hypothetical protein